MKYPKLRELKEAVKSLFSRPYTIKFPKSPSTAAPRFRGKPEYYKDDCVGCGACAEVCPSATIYMVDDLKTRMRTLTLRLDSCLFCGSCQANCITEKGIMLSREYDLATYSRESAVVSVEKELLICEHCGSVIGAKDHIRFLAKKLGILAYGNPALILAHQDNLKIAKVDAGMAKVLCPKCRRESMLKDEYGGL